MRENINELISFLITHHSRLISWVAGIVRLGNREKREVSRTVLILRSISCLIDYSLTT